MAYNENIHTYIVFLFVFPLCHIPDIEGPGSGWWRGRGASASLQRGVPLCKQVQPFKGYICYSIFLTSIRESWESQNTAPIIIVIIFVENQPGHQMARKDIGILGLFSRTLYSAQDILRGRRRRGYDPNDERYYVSDTNTGGLWRAPDIFRYDT